MEFILASNNQHKIEEIKRILSPIGHTVLSLSEAGIKADPEETGTTFAQNALIKAMEVFDVSGKAVIADDSGLVVEALDGAPGVFSARFAGPANSDEANNQKLLSLMQGLPKEKRGAKFVCAISVVFPDKEPLLLEGECLGEVGFEKKGDGGFGYDPLFYVGEKSFAELTAAEKDKISHRAKALEKLQKALQK